MAYRGLVLEQNYSYQYEHNYYSLGEYKDEISSDSERGLAAAGSSPISERNSYLWEKEIDEGYEGDLDEEDHLIPDGSTSNQNSGEQRPQELGQMHVSVMLQRRRKFRHRKRKFLPFMPWQVAEMEALFKEIRFPDERKRKKLAKSMKVPEAKVKMWFNKRRAKQRENQRRALLRAVSPESSDDLFMMDMEEL